MNGIEKVVLILRYFNNKEFKNSRDRVWNSQRNPEM